MTKHERTETSQITQTFTLKDLKESLVKSELQPIDAYAASLNRAQEVLRRQSGMVWLWQNVPVYALQDIHGDREMIISFLERRVPIHGGSLPLFDALRQSKANAVLLGDVAHAQANNHWRRDGHSIVGVDKNELATTMNAEQMAFDLVAEFPGNFIWLRGNHDSQRQTPFSVHVNDKGLAVASAMKDKFGEGLYDEWVHTEAILPLMAANKFVLLSHAAPGPDLDITDIRTKSETAYVKLAGTENRQGLEGSMSEKEMIENMNAILKQLSFKLDPNWVWIIGHRQTGLLLQCNERLLQVNQGDGQLYTFIKPDGSLFVGDCRSGEEPRRVKRKIK